MILCIIWDAEREELLNQRRVWRISVEYPENMMTTVSDIVQINCNIPRQITLNPKEPTVCNRVPEILSEDDRSQERSVWNIRVGILHRNLSRKTTSAKTVVNCFERIDAVILLEWRVAACISK